LFASCSFVKLLSDVCCYAGACALHLEMHDQMPDLHPNIDNQFLTAVTVTEVSGVFLPLAASGRVFAGAMLPVLAWCSLAIVC